MARPVPRVPDTVQPPSPVAGKGALLTVWISFDLIWPAAEGTGRRDRPQVFTDAAIQAMPTLKVLYRLPLRSAQEYGREPDPLAGLDWPVPHDSTLSRRRKNLAVEIPYRARSGPLHLVINGTGLKGLGEGEWKARRHGADERRVWRRGRGPSGSG